MFLGTLFWDASDNLRNWLAGILKSGEAIVGLRETGSNDRGLDAPLHLLVTTHRNALVAYDDDRDVGAVHPLPSEAPASVEKSLTRVTYFVAGELRFEATRLTSGDLDALFDIAWETRARMLYSAAIAHRKKKRWNDVDELLLACEQVADLGAAPTAPGYMDPAQEVVLLRSVAAVHRGDEDTAIELLHRLSAERPDDDLIAHGDRVDAPADWWMMLALAHEEAGDAASAASVYERLEGEHDDADLFVLSRARNLREAGDIDGALTAYDTFIASRDELDFRLIAAQSEAAEEIAESGSDVGSAAAHLEAAQMLTEAGRADEAFDRWIAAIRAAPYRTDGYEGLFDLVEANDSLLDERSFVLRQATDVLELVLPRLAESLSQRGVLPAGADRRPWEDGFEKLEEDLHDTTLVHPGERASASLAQKWTAALLKDERDVSAIAKHAQPADSPAVSSAIRAVSDMLGIEAPRAFLSHGSHGIDVLDRARPFVLIGAAHVQPDHELYLGESGLAFAVATQLEHVRAGHLLLTSSEFWKTFGTKSMTAVLAFVPMGDLLGKVTDGAVLKWIGKLKSGPSQGVGKMVQIVEDRVSKGAGRETVQSAYAATIGKLRQVGLSTVEADEEHLVKERLADFARCAQYTADRVGLLACGDLSDSVEAILRLSPSIGARTDDALDEGLVAALDERGPGGEPVHAELALRISELMKFALSDEYHDLRKAVSR